MCNEANYVVSGPSISVSHNVRGGDCVCSSGWDQEGPESRRASKIRTS